MRRNTMQAMGIAVALAAAVLMGPLTALAAPPEEAQLADAGKGVIPTNAVTKPVQVGDITYVPAVSIAAAPEPPPLIGTVPTAAVTRPITVGNIRYVPLP